MDNNSFSPPEKSQPINPLTISSATLSSTNPNGTLIIDTTQAIQARHRRSRSRRPTRPTEPRRARRSASTSGPTAGPPIRRSISGRLPHSFSGQLRDAVQLDGASGYPDTTHARARSATRSSINPSHGTITNFNPSTGTLTYTPSSRAIPGSVTFTSMRRSTRTVATPTTDSQQPGAR